MSNVIQLRNKRKKDKQNKAVKFLLIITIVLAIILFLMSKVFEIKNYEVIGNHLYSNEEILKMLKIDDRSNIIKIYMNSNRDLKAYPYIEGFELDYLSYNKLRINVNEKQVIGYIFYMSNYLCVDKDGYIVDYVKPDYLDDKIAILEGLTGDTLVIGEKINIPQEILDTCFMFNQAERKYGLKINLLSFKEENSRNISITIGGVKIIFGDMEHFNEKVQTIKDILSQIPEDETGTLYLGKDGSNSFYEKNLE